MSDYESHIGKLRKVDLKGKTKEQFFKLKCEEAGYNEMKESDWQETALYYYDMIEKYILIKDDIWEVFDHVQPDSFDGFHITDNKDGTYSFTTTFYNGGTCLSEILEEEVAKL